MKSVLTRFVGTSVAINLHRETKAVTATLQSVADDGFEIRIDSDPNTYFIPHHTVLHIALNPDGVREGHLFGRITTTAPVFIRLGATVENVLV